MEVARCTAKLALALLIKVILAVIPGLLPEQWVTIFFVVPK